MKQILFFILLLFGQQSFSQTDTLKSRVETKLKLPFGTITKLKVQIFDGDSLQTKEKEGVYLLKIISINDVVQTDTLLMTFNDETKSIANNNFGLYKLLYKKEASSLSQKDISKMKKIYVDKKFTIMAYETGQFSGLPKDYFKYQPIRADLNFHFKNYLVVVANLTK